MALFKSAVKVEPKEWQKPKNAGFVLQLSEITPVDGGVLLSGTAKSDSAVSKIDQVTKVFMTEGNFKFNLGHNLSRSLKEWKDNDPDWFKDTEVILGFCYEKDGVLQAKRAAVGTYCVNGRVKSPRIILNGVIGRPVLTMYDTNEKTTSIMTALPADADFIEVKTFSEKSSDDFKVDLDDFAEGLNGIVSDQTTRTANRHAGKGNSKQILYVTVPVYSPKDSFHVDSGDLLIDRFLNQTGNVMLLSENGKTLNCYFPVNQKPEDKTAMINKAIGFIDSNETVKAIPFVSFSYRDDKGTPLAKAYANYIGSRNANLSFTDKWHSHEKELSAFNNLEAKFTEANIIVEEYIHNNTKEKGFYIEKTVPASNISVDAMPSLDFNGEPPIPVSGYDLDESIDVAGLDFGMMNDEFDAELIDAMVDTPTAEAAVPPQRRPRNSGLSM